MGFGKPSSIYKRDKGFHMGRHFSEQPYKGIEDVQAHIVQLTHCHSDTVRAACDCLRDKIEKH